MSPCRALVVLALVAAAFTGAAPAAGAELEYPLAIAVDDGGVIHLVDRTLPGVWTIADGKLSLFYQASKTFRTPLNAPRCVAIDHEGRVLVGDSSTREVYRFDASGQPQPLTGGGIGIPMAIVVEPTGDLLVADLELHRIWRVPAAGGEPTVFADVPAPRGLWRDEDGSLWVVSHGADYIVRIAPDGTQQAVTHGRDPLEFPHSIVRDAAGNAYVCDGYAKAIWKISPGGEPQKWVSGEPLDNPVGIAWRGDRLLVVDPRAKAVFEIDPEGQLTRMEFASEQTADAE